jgi:hypothetical protein
MQDWLYSLPTTTLAIYCSAIFVVVSWLGSIFIRPILRLWLRNQPGGNDLVTHAYSGFGLLYGLLLGLLSVAVYQNLERIQGHVGLEAANLASIYRTAASYPEPTRGEIQGLLRDYTLYVIHKDWPAQKKGRINPGGANRLSVIERRLAEFEPQTKSEEILQEQGFAVLRDLRQARQARVLGHWVAIPGVLWYVVLVGAVVNMALFWLLDARLRVQLLLGGIVSFFLGVVIFLVIAMDRPTRGEVSVSTDAYQTVYDYVMRWDDH